ncbi:hypothetical protein COCSUDRAFT_58734 [Coccomyxa subellipsoidea C-169]|uniref:Uncharacterized protein n=1 Tax=Coccomyxa subellipsoidea (strain C-169) TaxID=574566 RepID=I0YM32_COCSC|nr:hypothetical protein COCSUDRAFT_58734 [Coccomyxa subellipsoidea C-169]EIE19451.1 hypothetical protein COCSUDRAFT_58734 [Coccomyxa subellipsoidea C-169]|eukprot:XP_005643995.1 hypothetical protein COCSUDRAFT_58734 [Coccomyxa subellipsoidea C-169]
MGLRVTCFHWSRDLSSSAQHGPGGASFTPGALASPPSAGGLAHHRTCLRGSPLGYPSARRIHRRLLSTADFLEDPQPAIFANINLKYGYLRLRANATALITEGEKAQGVRSPAVGGEGHRVGALLADWRLATVNVRQTAGVLSDWLRGRDPMITREQFAARWCHRAVLCALEELPGAQPVIHWSAQHPVPLPA